MKLERGTLVITDRPSPVTALKTFTTLEQLRSEMESLRLELAAQKKTQETLISSLLAEVKAEKKLRLKAERRYARLTHAVNSIEAVRSLQHKMTPQSLPQSLLPGEHRDIRRDVAHLLKNADQWLATPNDHYAGRRPVDLIGTPDEYLLRETLRSILYSGMA